MDHRPNDALNDATLAREIESMLAVDPSPEFAARVRTRIASEPASSSSWRWSLGFALAGAAAVVVIAVLIAPWMRSTSPEIPQQATGRADVTLEPAPASIPPEPDTTPDQRGAREGRLQEARSDRLGQTDRRAASDGTPFAEVLVSADEVRAYELVVGITRRQSLPAPSIEEPVGGVLPLVKIEPLTIEPLPQIARLETGERP